VKTSWMLTFIIQTLEFKKRGQKTHFKKEKILATDDTTVIVLIGFDLKALSEIKRFLEI